jgi:hypothetical protein
LGAVYGPLVSRANLTENARDFAIEIEHQSHNVKRKQTQSCKLHTQPIPSLTGECVFPYLAQPINTENNVDNLIGECEKASQILDSFINPRFAIIDTGIPRKILAKAKVSHSDLQGLCYEADIPHSYI